MVRIHEPTAEERLAEEEWFSAQPDDIRTIAEKFPPLTLYRLKTTGQCVTPHRITKDDEGNITFTVAVTDRYHQRMFEVQLYGINPDDLVPLESQDTNDALVKATGGVV